MTASQRPRICEACSQNLQTVDVQHILEDPLMRNSAILVFANKQDMVCTSLSVYFNVDAPSVPVLLAMPFGGILSSGVVDKLSEYGIKARSQVIHSLS
jgi:hypothetical protein